MSFAQFSSCRLLIILVCWLSVNDAIPHGSYPADQVRPTKSSQRNTEIDETTPIMEQLSILTETPKSGKNGLEKIKKSRHSFQDIQDNFNETNGVPKNRTNQVKNSLKNNKSKQKDPEKGEVRQNKKGVPGKCVNEVRRQNQKYTRSMPTNTSSMNSADVFKIAGDVDATKTSTVHIGEDIALCWIETTTIKEDPNFNPPKRLVIREFTISFENSATIPDNYLDCSQMEGEIATCDEDTVRKSGLHEVIDDNSMRSREINFTRVSNIDQTIIRQHKKVKCGVGVVVKKDIFEWPDGTDNPKKRVEIKVGPSIRDLLASDDKPSECTAKSIPKMPQAAHNQSSSPNCTSGENCDGSSSCENGNCSKTTTPCIDDDCSSSSMSEETVSTTSSPDSNEILSTGVTGRTTTTESSTKKLPQNSTLPHKLQRAKDDPCSETDIECLASKTTTVRPESDTRKSKTCSGEDCSAKGSSEGPTLEVPCDPSKNTSCLCSGDNCTRKEESTTTSSTKDSIEITTMNGESCENGSDSSCSIGSSEEVGGPVSADKRIDNTTTSSATGTNETTTVKSSDGRSSTQKDLPCDSKSEQCSVSTQSYSDLEKDIGKTNSTSLGKNSTNATGVTELPKAIRDPTTTETAVTCDGSDTDGCSTVKPHEKNILDEVMKKNKNDSSPIPGSSSFKTNKERLEPSKLGSKGSDRSSSCAESDEGCESADSSNESVSTSNPVDTTTDSKSEQFETTSMLPTSPKPEPVTNRLNTSVSGIPISTGLETGTPKPSTESIESVTSPDDKLYSDKRSSGTEGSGDFGATTVAPSSDSSATENISSAVGTTVAPSSDSSVTGTTSSAVGTTLSPQSCESLGNCGSNRTLSPNETKPITSTIDTKRPKNTSICDDSNESCEPASESCEDGSTDCKNGRTSPKPRPCDSTSGSCSLETSDAPVTSTPSTPRETELLSRFNVSTSTTAGTRRSIVITTPVPTPIKGRHRLALRIKVLLEHIDDNKEREQLVQVERHLLLREKPSDHGNNSLVLQLQSLNNSMNIETLKAIFNCSGLNNLSKDVIDLDELKNEVDLAEVKQKADEKVSKQEQKADEKVSKQEQKADEKVSKQEQKADEKVSKQEQKEDLLVKDSAIPDDDDDDSDADDDEDDDDDEDYISNDNSNLNSLKRRKREILIPLDNTTKAENVTDQTTKLGNVTDRTTDFKNITDRMTELKNITDRTTELKNSTDRTTELKNITDRMAKLENITDRMAKLENITNRPMKLENITGPTTEKTILEQFPGVQDDLKNGMDHILSRVAKEMDGITADAVNTTAKSSSSKILKILSDPSDSRIHSKSQNSTSRVKRVVSVQQLPNPVNGEEIERWSNERFVSAADGGQIRSLTEFRILRDHSEDS